VFSFLQVFLPEFRRPHVLRWIIKLQLEANLKICYQGQIVFYIKWSLDREEVSRNFFCRSWKQLQKQATSEGEEEDETLCTEFKETAVRLSVTKHTRVLPEERELQKLTTQEFNSTSCPQKWIQRT
jgi:hypothetical protein